jgi:hypothetical protein
MSDSPLPAQLARAQLRFLEWRSERGEEFRRIPQALWAGAVRCAKRYGIYQTARALGLDYACLKRRVMASPAAPPSSPAFVEFLAPGHGPPDCVLEIQSESGAKLRIELRGSAVPDVIDLARRFAKDEV